MIDAVLWQHVSFVVCVPRAVQCETGLRNGGEGEALNKNLKKKHYTISHFCQVVMWNTHLSVNIKFQIFLHSVKMDEKKCTPFITM
jgi:hypothetical protein